MVEIRCDLQQVNFKAEREYNDRRKMNIFNRDACKRARAREER